MVVTAWWCAMTGIAPWFLCLSMQRRPCQARFFAEWLERSHKPVGFFVGIPLLNMEYSLVVTMKNINLRGFSFRVLAWKFVFFEDFPENRRSRKGTNIWQFCGSCSISGVYRWIEISMEFNRNLRSAVDFCFNKWGQPSMRAWAGLKLSKLKSQVNSIWETQKAKAKFQWLIASWWILWESNLAVLLSISGCKRGE